MIEMFSPFVLCVLIGGIGMYAITIAYELVVFYKLNLNKFISFTKLRNFILKFLTISFAVNIISNLCVYFLVSPASKAMLDKHWFIGYCIIGTVVAIPYALGVYFGPKVASAFAGALDEAKEQ